MGELLKVLDQVPEVVAKLRRSGIPLSAVSGILRIVADIIDRIDDTTK